MNIQELYDRHVELRQNRAEKIEARRNELRPKVLEWFKETLEVEYEAHFDEGDDLEVWWIQTILDERLCFVRVFPEGCSFYIDSPNIDVEGFGWFGELWKVPDPVSGVESTHKNFVDALAHAVEVFPSTQVERRDDGL
jgi:hypothetical protein